MDYISIRDAANKLGLTYYALYCAVGRKSLKAVKRNDILHTTEGWLKEYVKNNRDKEKVSRFNGMKTFDETKGEYCVKRAAKMLGLKKQRVYWLIYTGQLKTTRKGSYHIITQANIDAYLNRTETIVTEVVV